VTTNRPSELNNAYITSRNQQQQQQQQQRAALKSIPLN